MLDRRRFATRREKPELLGLSTLDTVTCALAGAIVLMILMSFLTDQKAEVVQTDIRRIWESGDGKGGPGAADGEPVASSIAVENLAVLFLDLDAPAELTATVTKACNVVGDDSLYGLRSAAGHLGGSDAAHALVVWAAAADPACSRIEIGVGYGSGRGAACRATLVSGAHYQLRDYDPCPLSFELYSSRDQVFRFPRLQP